MVHCRSPLGAWKHTNRSFERGYLSRPPLAFGVEILPPPAPPMFFGVEKTGRPKRSVNWCDMSDDILETSCPLGEVCLLLDAPVSAKDFSQPKVLCLFELVEPDEKEEKVVAEDIIITAGHGESDDIIRRLQVKCRALEEEVRDLKEGMRDFAENLVATSSVEVTKAVNELVQKELAAVALTMQTICADLATSAVDAAFAAMKVSDFCQEVSGIDVAVEHYVDDAGVLSLDVAEEHYVEAIFAEDTIECTIAEEEVDFIDASLAEKGSIDCTFALEDTDNSFYLLNCLKLRVYCFPRENKFVWNINAKSFKPPLVPVEEAAWCEETFEEIMAYTAYNKVENILVTFDISGECSLAHLRTFQHRIKILQNAGLNYNACDFLCKMFDMIEFLPQSYLSWFAAECAMFVALENKFLELIASRPIRNDMKIQQHMKVYSFFRSVSSCVKSSPCENFVSDSANSSQCANSFASIASLHEDKIISSAQCISVHEDNSSCMSPELEDYYNSLALDEDYFYYDEFDLYCDESCVDTQEPDA